MKYLFAQWGLMLGLTLSLTLFLSGTLSAATIGTVVPVVGQVADLLHDANRNVIYVTNQTRNDVEIFAMDGRRLATINTGLQPGMLGMSPDGNTLYVANLGSSSISLISLTTQTIITDYAVGQRPDAIAVGRDGLVVILGPTSLQRLDPFTGRITTVPITLPPTPVLPVGQTLLGNFLAGLTTTANGNILIGMSSTRLFVYEVASGTVLRSRNVTGVRAILSASPDGTRFMAGPLLFDTQTLSVLGRAGLLANNITGGSAFSVDGNSVYANFSTQIAINPLNAPALTTPVLQVLRASSLTQDLGLRVPEVVTSKIVSSTDGQNLFATSTSGFMIIPIGNLPNLPILDVSASSVVLSIDPCNRTIATASVQIRNAGSGRATFAASLNNAAAPVVLSQRTGVSPATLTVSFTPPTGGPALAFGTYQYSIILASPEAVNVEPAILVSVNYRDVTQRGTILPINGMAVDMQMDARRNRIYLANYTRDQIEVFSLANQTFLTPIRVGNRPLSMAIVNNNTMVVANSGGENFSIIDLDAMQEVDTIQMGPLPLNATPLFPRSIAASSNAILFSAVPLSQTLGIIPGGTPASVWQLSLLTHSAFPRLNLGNGINNAIAARNALVASGDGSGIVLAHGAANGTANLLLYDPVADTFPINRAGAVPNPFRGTVSAAADGSFYVVDNTVYNSVLGTQGALVAQAPGIALPPGIILPPGFVLPPSPAQQATLPLGVVASGNAVVRVAGSQPPATLNTLQRINLTTGQPDLQVPMPDPIMDINNGAVPATRLWPPAVTRQELGINNGAQLLARDMTIDSASNVYALTWSGLSIVSVTQTAGRAPAFSASGVVNSPSKTGALSAGGLISIMGTNLADPATAGSTPLPLQLGGVCVTANEVSIPLFSTSPLQIDAQLPTNLTGRVTLTVRSPKLGLSSSGVIVQVNATGPSLFSIPIDGQTRAALFHTVDGAMVTPDYPADRDETLVLYASGLGSVSPAVGAGQSARDNPLSSATQSIGVSIGGLPYPVLSTYLAPDFVGLYAIVIYVPGNRARGNDLPVVVTAGGVSSAAGSAPLASVQ